eukprot:g5952.t1
MKRARDGQHYQQEEQEIPPPPPPRKRKEFAAAEQEIPPPPPPRNKKGLAGANGSSGHSAAAPASVAAAPGMSWSRMNSSLQPGSSSGGGGSGANVFSGSSSISPPAVSLPSSNPVYTAPKRAKVGLGEPDGWRATADEVLLKAGIGEDGKGNAGSSSRGDARGVPAQGDGGRGDKGQSCTEKAAAKSKRKFAVVCAANFNRSMMAHELLRKHNFQVESYGTSRDLRLPGKDIASPEVFPFGTPYRDLHDTLKRKDEAFFLKNNLLRLAARNATIKAAPQRFQDIEGPDMADFDVVLCFEARVFYSVVEDLQSRDPETFKPLHVINMTIKDSFEESAAASGNVLELCRTLDGLSVLEDEAAGVLEAFTRKSKRSVLHQVCHV